ncbi:PREDICTED: uncharacterized protein LOC106808273 isoform X2 [Priapulus caudatus]|uniref:Uncharacterized protein LOC106808273 isoform X2 n=1 Tax=Priapulus caudatus TaxID=37621 RepID=A0ABM1E2H9_PRICU|nr:PREDICTED: uncharacterized protein LOC106808273 isoform X2 [Priapulus caudatus]
MDSSGSNDNQFIASVNVEDKSKSISGGPVNTSLPNLVCELASMHKEQSLTLEKQQHVIVDLKKHLAKTQHEVKVLDGEREQISRKHSSYETMKCKLESTCTYLLTCLNDVVNENFGLAGQIREVNGKFSFQERLCANYGTMMKQYTEKVDEGEATHYTYQRLTQQQSQLTQLQQEEARLFAEEDYAQVISGKLAGQLEQETSSLQQQVNQQEQDINTKQEQVSHVFQRRRIRCFTLGILYIVTRPNHNLNPLGQNKI